MSDEPTNPKRNRPLFKSHPGILLFGLAAIATYMPGSLGPFSRTDEETQRANKKTEADLEALRKAEEKRTRKANRKAGKLPNNIPT